MTVRYRPPTRAGFIELPTWEVTWYEGAHERYRAEQLTGEKATINYCRQIAMDDTNSQIKGIRIDPVEVIVYPEGMIDPVDEMTIEQLRAEVKQLRQVNIDQGKAIAGYIGKDYK